MAISAERVSLSYLEVIREGFQEVVMSEYSMIQPTDPGPYPACP